MSNNNHPNKRIRDASKSGDRHAVVSTTTKSTDPKQKVAFPRPMPGIVILVHGVNDVGEAYPTQAAGLCEGLNVRLGRDDLTSGDWDIERSCPNMRKATYERRADAQGYNPIIPFYWGYRPVDRATFDADQTRYREELRKRGPAGAEAPYDAYYVEGRRDPRRGYQNMDCFNNWLDEHFCKNGGVFDNATTNLVDMWGPGSKLFGVVRFASTAGADLSHAMYENPHRIYQVNAARRLANLILMIRGGAKSRDDTINLVAHSQGTLVSMLANFLVANDSSGLRPADCLILNNSPYSLETPTLESWQSAVPQQSTHARAQTLVNFCKLIDTYKQAAPKPDELVRKGVAAAKAAGKAGHLNDTHGKVFNYFCLHDQVVSLLNVQGMGWQGVPAPVSDKAGPAFAQRVFVNGRIMHTPAGPYSLPDIDMPAANRAVPKGKARNVNAPQLPDLGCVFQLPAGCNTLGASDWGVYSGAAGAAGRNLTWEIIQDPRPGAAPVRNSFPLSTGELADVQHALRAQGKNWELKQGVGASGRGNIMITRYLSEQEMMERARETKTEISNHSAIVLNQQVSKCVTAFDLAVGQCKSYDETKLDGGAFWQKLLRVADWRDSNEPLDHAYYQSGILPPVIKAQMNKPSAIAGIVNETTTMDAHASKLRWLDARIARMNREKDQWPKANWEMEMRILQSERASTLATLKAPTQDSQLFPVAHQP